MGKPIERDESEDTQGIRDRYEPFIFDQLVMVDSEVLALVDPTTQAFVPMNKNPVVVSSQLSIAKSRSVVEAITDPVSNHVAPDN